MYIENKRILVVEDEFITAADLIANLEHMGFIVPASTDTGEEVLSLALLHSPDLILMDINLKGDMTGISAADMVKKKLDIPVVFLTGQSDEATISKAIKSEPFGYIIKPFEERALKTAIAMALYKHSIDTQLKASEERYRIIAESSDNLIAILNPDLSFDYINLAGSILFAQIPEDIIGKNLTSFLSPPDSDEMSKNIESVVLASETWHDRVQISLCGREIWIYSTLIPLTKSPLHPCQILWVARDITKWVTMIKKAQKEGITQIEKNMEQFQILNDQIRNPLTVIATYASMDEGPSCNVIMDAVQTIDDLVMQLDRGWIESEKVRSFLLRNYGHGGKL